MITGVSAFLAGVVLLHQQVSLPPLYLSGLIPPLLLLLIRWRPGRIPTAFALGLLWALVQAHWTLDRQLPAQLEGQTLQIEGVVRGLPATGADRTRFEMQAIRVVPPDPRLRLPGRIRLGWYHTAARPAPGERWRLTVRLKRPHGFMNPGGFDYEGWLYRQRIGATGYVRNGEANRRIGSAPPVFSLQRLRLRLREIIDRQPLEPRTAGLLKALIIGDRSGLDRAGQQLFRDTGSSHLVAISGLHIGIVAGLGFLVGRFLWSRSSRLTGWFAAPRAAALVALLAATLYAGLAGFSIPTQRALIMLLLVLGGVILNRPLRPERTLALVLLAVLLRDTTAVLSPGFWLSFGAVAVIMLSLSGRIRRPGALHAWLRIQLVIGLGLIPILLLWGLDVPLLAAPINLLLVPLFSLLLIPLALAAAVAGLLWPALGAALFQAAGWLIDPLWSGLSLVAPWSRAWQIGAGAGLPLWQAAAVLLGVLLLLLPGGVPGRWPGLLLLLPLGLPRPAPHPADGDFWFDLLDVGQGLSAVIQTRHHTLVYDVGPRYSDRFDAGGAVLVPFLRQRGVTRIDRLILSNGDADHRGGLAGLLRQVPVTAMFSGEPERIPATRPPTRCRAGTQWSWDGVRFRILHPDAGGGWHGNDASCVLRVENGAGSLLLPGDIEGAAERALLARQRDWLDVDLVVMPHHGSRSSSGPGLVRATTPGFALAASGYRNRYGFPRPQVVARWRAAGARVLNTADSGALHFRFEVGRPPAGPVGWRQRAGRFWNWKPPGQAARPGGRAVSAEACRSPPDTV